MRMLASRTLLALLDSENENTRLKAAIELLRLIKAELLIAMRDPGRAEETLEELQQRYEGREGLFIEDPLGDSSTLGDAIERMRDKKWWRG